MLSGEPGAGEEHVGTAAVPAQRKPNQNGFDTMGQGIGTAVVLRILFSYVNEISKEINVNENENEFELENVIANCDFDFCDYYYLCDGYCPARDPTPARQQQPMIFYVFVNEMNNEINETENKNKLECKCELKNVICNFYFDLCNGYLPTTCRTPYPAPYPRPTPRPKPFGFIILRVESREQLVLIGVFNDICSEIGFVNGGNNNENFYDIVFDYCELSPHTYAPPRQQRLILRELILEYQE